MLRKLSSLDLSLHPPEVQEAHRLLTNYLRSNLHRLDYPTDLPNGWQIGSGEIESACKGVIGLRLKGAGMRWRESGPLGRNRKKRNINPPYGTFPLRSSTNVCTTLCSGPQVLLKISFLPSGETVGSVLA